jgi:uncharacterized repeat protein (TIGR03806 family)
MHAHRTSGVLGAVFAGTFLALAIGCGSGGGGGGGSGGGGGGFGLTRRDPVTSLTFPPTSPTPGTITDAAAFPNLTFASPVGITAAPGDPTHLYVVEQRGRIRVFENRADVPSFSTFLDITTAVTSAMQEEGLLGLAFHPNYATNGSFYVCYIAAGNTPRSVVVARYQRSAGNPLVAATTETRLLTFSHPQTNHNGGCLQFGPDGFLYVSSGDGGGAGDTQNNALNTSTLLGKILRIDVDGTAGALPYAIPPTNPFASSTGTERKEIYAWGLRNPWRFSFDRTAGTLWCGDVGQGLNEEVDVVTNGGNYGWRAYEGNASFSPADQNRGPFIAPVYEYARSTGMGNCIIGGFVYRGPSLPSLVGAYTFSDNGGGGVWAMVSDGLTASQVVQIGSVNQPSSFGEDANGELYVCELSGGIRKFVPTGGGGGTFPQRLSDTGIFRDLATLTPETGLIPYEVNAQLWSDGATKSRLMALPGVERITFSTDGAWTFPVGTAFVKTFHLPLTVGDPSSAVRVETRVLIQGTSGWDGYTYRWRDDQTDADLLHGADTRTFTVSDPAAPGGSRSQTWQFPSRTDCMRCHTAAAGRVLGVHTRQIHRLHDYDGVVDDQLRAWDHVSLFTRSIGWPGPFPAHADPTNAGAAVSARARAYLDVNCSMCHRPGGPSQSPMDLRTLASVAQMNVRDVAPQFGDLGVSNPRIVASGDRSRSILWHRMRRLDGFRMPPLASSVIDAIGEDLIGAWIDAGP